MPKCSISSKLLVFIYKYIWFPLLVLFCTFGIFITVYNTPPWTIEHFAMLGIITVILTFSCFWFFSINFILIDDDGIYYKNVSVEWRQITKIQFLKIGPPLVRFNYLKNDKTCSVRTILPISKFSCNKSKILTYSKKHG
jgi:hypothetical protein